MALRIKAKWNAQKLNDVSPTTLMENAGAYAFIAWRLALDAAKNLHGEGFDYDSDRERIGVITEYTIFALHVADRVVHPRLDDEQRSIFVQALADRFATLMQENLEEIAGPGNYRSPFIAVINARGVDYAELTFDGTPGYDFYRYLGHQVLDQMGETQTNRWVIDQVMELDAPELFAKARKAVEELFDSAHHSGDEEG